jgi:hypothetical protein
MGQPLTYSDHRGASTRSTSTDGSQSKINNSGVDVERVDNPTKGSTRSQTRGADLVAHVRLGRAVPGTPRRTALTPPEA